jgi:hypothetical protein
MLWVKSGNSHTKYQCVAPLDFNKDTVHHIAVAHKDFLSKKGEYGEWLDRIETLIGIERDNKGYWILPYSRWQTHLVLACARGPYEGGYDIHQIVPPKEGALTRLLKEFDDPWAAWVHMSEESNNTEYGFHCYNLTGHGFYRVQTICASRKIPLTDLSIVQAFQDLKESEYGINDNWARGNFLGVVSRQLLRTNKSSSEQRRPAREEAVSALGW